MARPEFSPTDFRLFHHNYTLLPVLMMTSTLAAQPPAFIHASFVVLWAPPPHALPSP